MQDTLVDALNTVTNNIHKETQEDRDEIIVRREYYGNVSHIRYKHVEFFKREIAQIKNDYKTTDCNICTFNIHGKIKLIIKNKKGIVIEKYITL